MKSDRRRSRDGHSPRQRRPHGDYSTPRFDHFARLPKLLKLLATVTLVFSGIVGVLSFGFLIFAISQGVALVAFQALIHLAMAAVYGVLLYLLFIGLGEWAKVADITLEGVRELKQSMKEMACHDSDSGEEEGIEL